jgi:hypothetical protein
VLRILALPLAIAASLALIVNPAHAQASRTWVSGVGDDANPCSRTAPCKTFAGAISKTAINGEINCLDPGGFGTVTITKSISIDCHEIPGSILNAGTNGVNVAFDSFALTDTRKTVNLRNLMIQGFDSGLAGINIIGAGQGSNVYVEDTLITGEFGGSGNGIIDSRGRGMLVVNNTTIRNLGGAGISVSSSNNGSRRAMISNTRVYGGNFGIVVGVNAEVEISHSVVSGMTSAGVQVTQASGIVDIDSSVIAHNGTGVQSSGVARISNNEIAFNTTGVTTGVLSYSNNRFKSNGTDGSVTAIGSTTNPTGQH